MKDLALGGRRQVPPGRVPGGTASWRAVAWVLRSPLGLVNDLANDLATTFFPGDCRVCGGPLSFSFGSQAFSFGSQAFRFGETYASQAVCEACVARVQPQQGVLCARCGEAMGMESERFTRQATRSDAILCASCHASPPAFAQAVAYGVYTGELREMLHLLKYDHVRSIAPLLGGWLAQAVQTLPLPPHTRIVAVPLFAARQRARGFNQAELLADAAARRLPAPRLQPAHRALRRIRDTDAQFSLTPHARRANLRGAFEVTEPSLIAGQSVLLVDDIYTTGATTRECARVLRAAGAAAVWVATLARAQTETVALWDGTLRPPETMAWS